MTNVNFAPLTGMVGGSNVARSSDPETCAGGEASPDVVAETGTGARAVELRGELCAGRGSRTYTLVYEARDGAGNVGTAQVAVVVSR